MKTVFITTGYMVVLTALGTIIFLINPAVAFLLRILDDLSFRFRRGPYDHHPM